MADSVDRVFAHALNTVKRIRSARPPPADRLKLYGLYKQSTEGDVEGVMDRPTGEGQTSRADREKWDAWHGQGGLEKTEAKRRYIETLVETMKRYASQTPDARELIAELEFVWDQIKSNPPSSSSSSNSYPLPGQSPPRLDSDHLLRPPILRANTISNLTLPGAYPTPTKDDQQHSNGVNPSSPISSSRKARAKLEPLRIVTPTPQQDRGSNIGAGSSSGSDGAEDAREAEALKSPETPGLQVFVDAHDSQPDFDQDGQVDTSVPASMRSDGEDASSSHVTPSSAGPPSPSPLAHQPTTTAARSQRRRPKTIPPPQSPLPLTPSSQPETKPPPRRDLQTAAGALIAPFTAYITKSSASKPPKSSSQPPSQTTPITSASAPTTTTAAAATQKWQRRVEASLIKLTAELAALREQLEMQRQHHHFSQPTTLLDPLSLLPGNPFRRPSSPSPPPSPFSSSRWKLVLHLLLRILGGFWRAALRTVVVDAVFLAAVAAWCRWKGYRMDEVIEWVRTWTRGLQQARLVRAVTGTLSVVGGKVGGVVEGTVAKVGGTVGKVSDVLVRQGGLAMGAASGVRFLPRGRGRAVAGVGSRGL